MKVIILFLTFCSFAIYAADESVVAPAKSVEDLDRDIPNGKMLSRYYRRGNYLIYDCEDGHFACVDDLSYARCQKWRNKAIDKVKEYMPCAPLTRFDSIEKCDSEHYKYIYNFTPKKFCLRAKKKN